MSYSYKGGGAFQPPKRITYAEAFLSHYLKVKYRGKLLEISACF